MACSRVTFFFTFKSLLSLPRQNRCPSLSSGGVNHDLRELDHTCTVPCTTYKNFKFEILCPYESTFTDPFGNRTVLNKKIINYICVFSSYRAVNTPRHRYKENPSVISAQEIVCVCSDIRPKPIKTFLRQGVLPTSLKNCST